MEKKFNRSMAREISQKVQEVLSKYIGEENFEFTINGGTLTDDKLKLNLEVRLKDADGSLTVSDSRHELADSYARIAGLKFEGHLIGSSWHVRGNVYTVVDYNPKRRTYPVSLKRADGRMSKAQVMFLAQGIQYVVPTQEDFIKWFTIDPDSDAVLESDVEICDRVQRYLEDKYPVEDGDKFFALVDKFNEKNIAKKWAKRAYELLFKEGNTMETAYLGLKVLYKETEKSKTKTSRK